MRECHTHIYILLPDGICMRVPPLSVYREFELFTVERARQNFLFPALSLTCPRVLYVCVQKVPAGLLEEDEKRIFVFLDIMSSACVCLFCLLQDLLAARLCVDMQGISVSFPLPPISA